MVNPYRPDYSNTPVSSLRPGYRYAPGDTNDVPAVSVVTPFYNAGVLFHQTAASVKGQSFQQWEWIIVDDCSDDHESVVILESYAQEDARIRVVRTPGRGGPGVARNIGVAQAKAPYVAFIDSDDLIEPTALEKWRWFLESHPQYAMVKGFQVGFGAQSYLWREGFHSGPVILERNPIQPTAMIRRDVYLAVGGMDASIRHGMEDWDFWLKCAAAGHWGGTVPEFLEWYRRRESHQDRWSSWDGGVKQAQFRSELQKRYPLLFNGAFPVPEQSLAVPYAEIPPLPSFSNRLAHQGGAPRLLIVVPHLEVGGSDKFGLDLMAELIGKHRYEITVAATRAGEHPWRHQFEALTPDVFTLDTFLRLCDWPRFLTYLIHSRAIDTVLITHSELGYRLLPYLRTQCPGVRFYDYVHIEEPSWKSGGYPAMSIAYQPFLDHTGASSEHLKGWMTERGAQADKISVVTTDVDTEVWRRDLYDGVELRKQWEVPADLPLILFVGRLCDQKQPDVLARAVQILEERGVSFLCLIVGGGESHGWLQSFFKKHNIRSARLLGRKSNDEIKELMAISQILLLPSKHEGIALTLYEAMAMEVVPVAANVGGQEELVTPECGVLISRSREEALHYADAIERILNDPALLASMAAESRRRVVAGFRLEQMGERMFELLRGRFADQVDHESADPKLIANTYAREVVEQYRLEAVATWLWEEPRSKVQPQREQPVKKILGILRPLVAHSKHSGNRKMLFQALVVPRLRRELLTSFDSGFYSREYPDIPSQSPLPLLHYVFRGYIEGRLPSAQFDLTDFYLRNPEASKGSANPLLWKICRERAGQIGLLRSDQVKES
jgi:glycosyltransferase involved in cell wall biosynthesis